MKKALIIIGIIFVLLIGTMIIVPIVFRGKIFEKAKEAINDAVEAKVEVEDIKISLFKSFPNVFLGLNGIKITGLDDFEGQQLVKVDEVSTTVDLSSLWSGEGLNISRITINNPEIFLLVNKDGKANWDIVKSAEVTKEQEEKGDDTSSSTNIELEKLTLSGASFYYTDESSSLSLSLKNGMFELSGEMQGSSSRLDSKGSVEDITLVMNDSRYVKNMNVAMKIALQADFDNMLFNVLENEILVNRLPLEANGSFSMNDEDMNFDVRFSSPQSQLGELLGFIPEDYHSYLEGLETKGEVAFNGYFTGLYNDKEFPSFGIDLNVSNGWLKYTELPKDIDGIELRAQIKKPQGDLDLAVIDVNNLQAILSGNPLSAKLHIATPMSDPRIEGKINGKIDFVSVAEAIPMDDIEIEGVVEANISFFGKSSYIEKERYDLFKTDGRVSLNKFVFESNDFNEKIEITSANMELTSKNIALSRLYGKIGRSDFSATGSIEDYWAYILKDQAIKGQLNIKSKMLDMNQLTSMGNEQESTETKPEDTVVNTEDITVTDIPANINFVTHASVDKILYGDIAISNTTGKVTVKNGKMILDGLRMEMLKGEVVADGEYMVENKKVPLFDFKLAIKNFDVPETFKAVPVMRAFVPMSENSTGSFASGLKIKGKLNSDYSPVIESFNGSGNFSCKGVELKGSGVFTQVGTFFKKGKFNRVNISDFTTNFNIVDGALDISPFKTNIAGQQATISGRQTASSDLNYKIDFLVNKDDLGNDIVKMIGFIPGSENITEIPITVNIKGNFSAPKVTPDLTEATNLVKSELKKQATKELENAVKKLGGELKKLFK